MPCAMFDESDISAITAFVIQLFPLNIPCTQRSENQRPNVLKPKDINGWQQAQGPKY